MFAIEARDVARIYAGRRGVWGVSFAVRAGECYAVLGPNGSGKSTLTRLLVSLERPTGGSLTVLGCGVGWGSRRHLQRCGVVLDSSVHWPSLTGRQNAWFAARTYGLTPEAAERRLRQLFELADLSEHADVPVAEYSLGMRRKLSIVQALCHDPELLIVDEPTIALDPAFAARLAEVVGDRCARGRTTWLAGNDPEWTASVATRAALLEAGRIRAEGTVDELLAGLARRVRVVITLTDASGGQLRRADSAARGEDAAGAGTASADVPGLHSLKQTPGRVEALLDPGPEALGRLIEWLAARGGQVRSLEVVRPTLRDALLASAEGRQP